MDIKTIDEIVGKRIKLQIDAVIPAQPEKKFVDCVAYNIVLKDTNERIGSCTARPGMNDVVYYIGNIGYGIDEKYRGHGYAVEAVTLLLEIFRLNNFDKVIISQVPDNTASKRVCEKLNAKFLGVKELPKDHIRRTEFGDTHMNIWELEIK